MIRPSTHAAERYINEYVDLILDGDKSARARHLRVMLITKLNYTKQELDSFVEERLLEIDQVGRKTKQLDTSKLDVEPYFESN